MLWCNNSPLEVGSILSGVMSSYNTVITRNRKYFAYASNLIVNIFDIKNLKLVNSIFVEVSPISTISLCQTDQTIIVIALQGGNTRIYNFIRNTCVTGFNSTEKVVSICWEPKALAFIAFTRVFDRLYRFSFDPEPQLETINGRFDNLRMIDAYESNELILIGGNRLGTITRMNLKQSIHDTYSGEDHVVTVELDPNSQEHCLCIWITGVWALFDVTSGLNLITLAPKTNYQIGAGTWLISPPGHFITGDLNNGILRIWNSVQTTPIESITIHSCGFVSILCLDEDRLICGFSDGLLSIFDMKLRTFMWKNAAGHRAPIIALSFLPASPNSLISFDSEGALCLWDSLTFEQLDRMPPKDPERRIQSVAVSKGGGFAVCGCSNGYIVCYSLKILSEVFEQKIGESAVIKVDFDAFDPNKVILVLQVGQSFIFDLQKKEKKWGSGQIFRSAAFSPHCPNTFALVSETEDLLIVRESAPTTIKIRGKRLNGVIWSPHDEKFVIVTTKEGVASLVNIITSVVVNIFVDDDSISTIAFHPTMSNLVVGGTNGGDVIIFDTAQGKKACFHAHQGSIFAVQFSAGNPYLLATSSSDSTIAFWSIDMLCIDTQIESLSKAMYGPLRPLIGEDSLIRLAKRIGKSPEKLSFPSKSIVHINDSVRLAEKRIQKNLIEPEDSRITNPNKRKQVLVEAAKMQLHIGNTKEYCILMMQAGEVSKAIAAAPSVSVEFWREMLDYQAKENEGERVKCMISSGRPSDAVDYLMKKGEFNSAFLVSKGCNTSQNLISLPPNTIRKVKKSYSNSFTFEEYCVASKEANYYCEMGETYLAASSFLSIGDTLSAELLLLRHGEPIAAMAVDILTSSNITKVRETFATICIGTSQMDYGFGLLPEKSKEKIACAMQFQSKEAMEEFYKNYNMRSLEQLVEWKPQTKFEEIERLFLMGDSTNAISEAISFLKDKLSQSSWDFSELAQIFDLVQISNLTGVPVNLKDQILGGSYIIALYRSIWKGYKAVFEGLLEILIKLCEDKELTWLAPPLEALKIFAPGKKSSAPIVPVCSHKLNSMKIGHSFDSDLKYGQLLQLDDMKTDISRQHLLQWNDVTKFSPLGNDTRYYCV